MSCFCVLGRDRRDSAGKTVREAEIAARGDETWMRAAAAADGVNTATEKEGGKRRAGGGGDAVGVEKGADPEIGVDEVTDPESGTVRSWWIIKS